MVEVLNPTWLTVSGPRPSDLKNMLTCAWVPKIPRRREKMELQCGHLSGCDLSPSISVSLSFCLQQAHMPYSEVNKKEKREVGNSLPGLGLAEP